MSDDRSGKRARHKTRRRDAQTRWPWVASSLLVFLLSPLVAAQAQTSWSHHRGNSAQTGAATGTLSKNLKLMWKQALGSTIHSSAVMNQNQVFIGTTGGTLFSLSRKTGETLWFVDIGSPIEAAPTLWNDTVLIGGMGGTLFALNAHDGSVRWKTQTQGKIMGSANIVRSSDDVAFAVVGSYDGKIYALNLTTGEAVWTYSTGNYVHGSPAVTPAHVIAGGCDQFVHVIDKTKGAVVRKIKVGSQVGVAVTVHKNHAFLGTYGNRFVALDLATGKELWSYKSRDFPFLSSAAIGGDALYFGGRDRRVHAVYHADGAVKWTMRTRGRVDAPAVWVDAKVVIGSHDGRVYMLNDEDGSILWSYELGGPVLSSPAVDSGMMVIASEDGYIYAFGSKTSTSTP
jgi:outer membrane protein assembly factor BamB